MGIKLDRDELISRLDSIEYQPAQDDDQQHLEQMNLGGVLLALADISHEREYEVCRSVAEHLLGEVYEPDDIVME
jgi:hypothetical protein